MAAIRHQSKEEPFDLVITDMTMPHLTGADLAKELFKLQPHLTVLLCTGFSEKMDAEKAATLSGVVESSGARHSGLNTRVLMSWRRQAGANRLGELDLKILLRTA